MSEMSATNPGVWPALVYDDAEQARRFLVDVVGFVEQRTVRGEGDGTILHGELRWPEGGGVMYGSTSTQTTGQAEPAVGRQVTYVVTGDPEAVYRRARQGGATIVAEPEDTDYGSRAFTLADPEGNVWRFGTYSGG